MLRFVDLFSGIGGIRLGFENACDSVGIDHECVFSSEIDTHAQRTYRLNFGETPSGDIYGVNSIPDCDMVLAGFPCQPFSHAGKRRGFDDTRGTLFHEIARLLRDSRPSAFLLENVRGITTNDSGRTFETILNVLNDLGYGVESVLLNSCNFGVPQNRLRVYIVGVYGAKPNLAIKDQIGPADSHSFKRQQSELFPAVIERPLVKNILQSRPAKKYRCSDDFVEKLGRVVGKDFKKLHGVRLIDYRGGNSIHSWDLGIKGNCSEREREFMNLLISNRRKKKFGKHQDGKKLTINQIQSFYGHNDIDDVMASLMGKGYLKRHGDRFDPVCGNMSFEVFKFLDPESISITLTSSDCHRLGVVQRNRPRRITPRECARLQGFADDFKPHPDDKHAYAQFGNSVSVPVIEHVLTKFLEQNPAVVKRRRNRAG